MIGEKEPITTTLVGMNVAVYVVMVLTGVSPVTPTVQQLLKWGANCGTAFAGCGALAHAGVELRPRWDHSHRA